MSQGLVCHWGKLHFSVATNSQMEHKFPRRLEGVLALAVD